MSKDKELRIRNSTSEFLIFTRQAGEDGIEVRVAGVARREGSVSGFPTYCQGASSNEAETRAKHIDPVLAAVGWGVAPGSRVRREYPITLGYSGGKHPEIPGSSRRRKP